MANVCRLQLDVLKAHKPDAYDFSLALSELNPTWNIKLEVIEIDESTESICLDITGKHVDFDQLKTKINELGATVHSIDVVEVHAQSKL